MARAFLNQKGISIEYQVTPSPARIGDIRNEELAKRTKICEGIAKNGGDRFQGLAFSKGFGRDRKCKTGVGHRPPDYVRVQGHEFWKIGMR